MPATVYAMCGLAFSGKSTAARTVARELGLALICLDAINDERGLDGGKGIPDSDWGEATVIEHIKNIKSPQSRARLDSD